jgi:Mn-dependent DtxR family transcriptional regulator
VSMKYNKSIEMYLETIYILEIDHGHAHVVDIAEHLGITKPSVTKASFKIRGISNIHNHVYFIT